MYTSPKTKQPYSLQGKTLAIPAETFWIQQAPQQNQQTHSLLAVVQAVSAFL